MKSTNLAVPMGLLAVLAGCSSAGARAGDPASVAEPAYLAKAHSHNDYGRGRPLLDAVERGFASVEVDVFLVDGELYVAHDAEDVDRSGTLAALYLDPIRDLVRRNGGRIYRDDPRSLQLLVDVKTPADETYRALAKTLADYAEVFTTWRAEGVTPGPVTALVSGNRAVRLLLADTVRLMALDGRIEDDRVGLSPEVMPLVSIDWAKLDPTAPGGRRAEARELVSLLHDEGRKVRFWGTPDDEDLWLSLTSMGVDYIGTDDSRRLQRFLLSP